MFPFVIKITIYQTVENLKDTLNFFSFWQYAKKKKKNLALFLWYALIIHSVEIKYEKIFSKLLFKFLLSLIFTHFTKDLYHSKSFNCFISFPLRYTAVFKNDYIIYYIKNFYMRKGKVSLYLQGDS